MHMIRGKHQDWIALVSGAQLGPLVHQEIEHFVPEQADADESFDVDFGHEAIHRRVLDEASALGLSSIVAVDGDDPNNPILPAVPYDRWEVDQLMRARGLNAWTETGAAALLIRARIDGRLDVQPPHTESDALRDLETLPRLLLAVWDRDDAATVRDAVALLLFRTSLFPHELLGMGRALRLIGLDQMATVVETAGP
jgi:hypothetical protein